MKMQKVSVYATNSKLDIKLVLDGAKAVLKPERHTCYFKYIFA